MVAVNIAAVSEALMLGKKAGVDPEMISQAIRGGLVGSTVMDAKAPMMLDHHFKPGFRIDLHIKALNSVFDAAKSVDAPTPLTAQVFEMIKVLRADGCSGCDHSALAMVYEKLAGEEISRAEESLVRTFCTAAQGRPEVPVSAGSDLPALAPTP